MYPVFPALALVIATVALVAMSIYNPVLAVIYFGILLLAYGWFEVFVRKNLGSDDSSELARDAAENTQRRGDTEPPR